MFCFECREFYPFPLKEHKKSVTINNYVGGRDDDPTLTSRKKVKHEGETTSKAGKAE